MLKNLVGVDLVEALVIPRVGKLVQVVMHGIVLRADTLVVVRQMQVAVVLEFIVWTAGPDDVVVSLVATEFNALVVDVAAANQ